MVSDKWYLQPHIATGRSHPCGISSLLLCLEAGTCRDTRRMPTVLVEEEEKCLELNKMVEEVCRMSNY